jgi:signal transduction histidine kinase
VRAEADGWLLSVVLTDESDVFLVRRRGREVAMAVGLEGIDQIRVATALSDLGRDLVRQPHPVTVVFRLTDAPRPALVVEFSRPGDAMAIEDGVGWHTGVRLMDGIRLVGGTVVLVKHLPPGAPGPAGARLAELRDRLARLAGGSAVDELRSQNQELVRTLENLERKQAELTRLNAELADTNQGVLALYKELSEELEQTNRGVVALYAELDDKSTQLKDANRAKTRFWSNISHELRTPINSIVGLAGLLAAPGSDPLTEEQSRQVSLIQDSGATLLALVNELLDTAKAESGQLVPRPVPVQLDAVFAQLRGMLRPLATSDDVRLVIDEPPPLRPVLTDEVLLVRILRNLLSNGLKFTQQGEVRLTAEVDDAANDLVIVVRDTGIGIPADLQDRVFEEFYQVPGELQVRRQGTGLGLPYARRLAEILDGSLTLASEVDRGTCLTLRLPLRLVDTERPTRLHTALVVDDDADFRHRLRDMIAGLAATVVEAHDGESALDAVAEHRPDLIFLDLRMPGMSGEEVLTALRGGPGSSNIPVVVVTSAEVDTAEPVLSGVAVLSKSRLSPASLRHAVLDLLPPMEGTAE